jgi:hypothetical protein
MRYGAFSIGYDTLLRVIDVCFKDGALTGAPFFVVDNGRWYRQGR